MKNESENKRIEQLLALLQSQPHDVFVQYALALEWKKEGQLDKAIQAMEQLLETRPDYLAAYYQLGHLLLDNGQHDKAISTFENGIQLAIASQDLKTLSELKNAKINAQIED